MSFPAVTVGRVHREGDLLDGDLGGEFVRQAVGIDEEAVVLLFEALHLGDGLAVLGDPGGVAGFEGGRGFGGGRQEGEGSGSPRSVRRSPSRDLASETMCSILLSTESWTLEQLTGIFAMLPAPKFSVGLITVRDSLEQPDC